MDWIWVTTWPWCVNCLSHWLQAFLTLSCLHLVWYHNPARVSNIFSQSWHVNFASIDTTSVLHLLLYPIALLILMISLETMLEVCVWYSTSSFTVCAVSTCLTLSLCSLLSSLDSGWSYHLYVFQLTEPWFRNSRKPRRIHSFFLQNLASPR